MNIELRLQKAVSSLEDSVGEREPRDLPSVRRVMFVRVALAALMIGLTALVAIPAIRNSSITKVRTADQPGKLDDGGSQVDTGPAPTQGGSGSVTAPGTDQGKSGTAPGNAGSGSGSRGSLPAGTIPQGFEIAFGRGHPSSRIFVTDAEGSNTRLLQDGAQPEWSPDGKFIAFFGPPQSDRNSRAIQIMDANGSSLQSLRVGGFSPTWSPDGRDVLFSWACHAEAGETCLERAWPTDPAGDVCGPECGIGVIARDGTRIRQLGNGIWPAWGPDGRIIFADGVPTGPCDYDQVGAYDRTTVNGETEPMCELPLWVMNADGSGRTRLPIDKAIWPTWSRDGRRIAFSTATDGVFVANADGKGVRKVAPAGYNHPSWSPDDTWLALTRYTNQFDRDGNIVLRSIDGSTEKRLTTGGFESQPAFSPVAR